MDLGLETVAFTAQRRTFTYTDEPLQEEVSV